MSAMIEPFFYCLFASVIWAPLVFFGAHRISAKDAGPKGALGSLSGKVWPVALMIAALPVLTAPIAASLGLSLRSPAPLPPMAEMAAVATMTSETAQPVMITETAAVSLADVLRTAAVLYFYGFLMLLALAVVRHIWFAYRLNYAIAIDEPALEAKLEQWRERIGVTQQPRYVFSHIVSSVCVYGFFRPVIVMPYALLERVSIEDAALMGAHEMAHVKRGDVALFALCSVVKAIFWFNPFMHRICARANLAAEQGADALVLARGVSRRQYAHCFVQGLKLAAGAPQNRFTGELVPSFTPFDKRSRRARLDAILSGEDQTSILSLPAKLSVGAAAVLAAGLAFAQAAFAVSPPAPTHALPVAPVEGEIGFGYGKQSKLLGGDRQYHEGVDIRAKRGTPVRAAGEGKIIDATERYRGSVDWGKVVVIDHGHGLVTRYAHLDSYLVRKGDRVEAGDIIGAVGSTGKATGPHLHFEVIEDGKTIDPSPVLALAPASPPRPAAVPSPAPKIKTTRNVQIAPMPPKAALAPEVDANVIVETAPKVDVELNEKHARKLERRLAKLESKLRDRFENFDAFSDLDDIVIKFDDFELEGLDGVEAFSEMLEGQEFHFESGSDFRFVTPDGMRFAFNADLSEEEKQEIRRTHEKAKREAARQMERAREEIKRAKVEAERVRREALTELNERNRERMLEQAERKREIEIERMEREVEREMARAEREIELAEHKHERKQAAKAQNAAERLQYEQDRLEREQERMKREQARIEREQARMEREQARMQKERERLRRELKRLEDKKQDR